MILFHQNKKIKIIFKLQLSVQLTWCLCGGRLVLRPCPTTRGRHWWRGHNEPVTLGQNIKTCRDEDSHVKAAVSDVLIPARPAGRTSPVPEGQTTSLWVSVRCNHLCPRQQEIKLISFNVLKTWFMLWSHPLTSEPPRLVSAASPPWCPPPAAAVSKHRGQESNWCFQVRGFNSSL